MKSSRGNKKQLVSATEATPEVTPEVRLVRVLKVEMTRQQLRTALGLKDDKHFRVERDEATAKFWLWPVRLQKSGGFRPAEVPRIQRLIERHRETLLRSWNVYFKA